MKIIGCYIVKNEAEALCRSIATIQNQVDEIVVVDTGSDDNTITVAQKVGAKIHHFTWQDDFSLARNFALEKLSGDWVVFLDADEFFHADTMQNLRQFILRQHEDTNLILIRRQDVDEAGNVMMSLYVPRIFRICADLRYKGSIHEELRQNGGAVKGIVYASEHELLLMHTGYAGARGRAKAQRNLELLLKEMERSDSPERLYGYLAEAYDGIDDREQAMQYAYKDIARGRQAETYASRSYRLLLEKLAENKRDYRERQRVAAMAIKDFPEVPEFYAEYAESLAVGWQYAEAASMMRKAYELGGDYHGIEPSFCTAKIASQWQERESLFSKMASKGERLSITACVIVRNEEKNISAWLRNTEKYANQRIVLDTGSTDRTCELAAEAELHHYVWQDDFAAARNEVLQYVKGDWVVFLDADEYFSQPEQIRGFLAACEIMHHEIEAVRVTIKNVDADDGMREISHFCNVRMFRNHPDLRYKGRIHENLVHKLARTLVIWEESDIEVIHTGYSSSIIMEKTERNLALLRQDMEEQGPKPEHYRYLADCYFVLGDYRQAELYALQAIDAPLQGMGTKGDMYYMVLLCMKALNEPLQDRLNFATAAEKNFAHLPDFVAVQGLLYYEQEQFGKAADLLEKACYLARQDNGHESSAFGDIQALVYATKADCEKKLGNMERALQDSRTAMELNSREELALEIFCELRQDEDELQLIRELQSYFADSQQDVCFLARFCERNGFGRLHAYYCGHLRDKWGLELPRQEYYQMLKDGNWSHLVDKIQAGLAEDVERIIALLLRLQEKRGRAARQAEQQLIALLPVAMQECWQQLAEGAEVAAWDIYKTLWNYVLSYGSEAQILHFAEVAQANEDIRIQLMHDLLQKEQWQIALKLLSTVPKERANGRFWQVVGRCLYHLGEYSASVEAFAYARRAGEDTLLLKSYEKWLAEKIQKNA